MTKPTYYVGLDVHAETISIAVADEGRGEARFIGKRPHDLTRVLKELDRIGERSRLHVAYEAGPTGYGLQRALTEAGIECEVIAPSKMDRAPGDRVKTDRLDALNLARKLRAGELTSIYIPDAACEAMRDLLRARDDARHAKVQAQHRLSKFMLRLGRRWTGKSNWTCAHYEWLEIQKYPHVAQQRAHEEYLHTVHEAVARLKRHDHALRELVPETELAELVEALQAFRGVQFLTAASIAFELGDLRRFRSPAQLAGYLGLVPSEESSGNRVRRGKITKAGNKGLRRILVEAAWAYRHVPRENVRVRRRAARVAPGVRRIAWSAQVRCNKLYRKLTGRRKLHQKVVVAVARELTGFLWAVGQEDQLIAQP